MAELKEFKNPYPTMTEMEMFRYAGFYLVEKTKEDLTYAKVDKLEVEYDKKDCNEYGFPVKIAVSRNDVDYDAALRFNCANQIVKLGNACPAYADVKTMKLVVKRMHELGFK